LNLLRGKKKSRQLRWEEDVSRWDLEVLRLISVTKEEAKQYFKHYARFHNVSEDESNRLLNFLMYFDCERTFVSQQLFLAGFDDKKKDSSVSFVQFVYTCWYICNLSLEDLYRTSFAAFDLSNEHCIMLDDLTYIFRNVYGFNWKKNEGAKKLFIELHDLGISHNLRIDYATYHNTIIHHTTFLNCIFEVHRRVRDVIFGEKHWHSKMGNLGISEKCLNKKWDRDRLMMYVKFNSPLDILKTLNKNYNHLKEYPVTDDQIFIDRNGNIIPDRNDDQDHLRKKNHIDGVDRTAWVFSSQPRLERARTQQRLLEEETGSPTRPATVEEDDKPTHIPEHDNLDNAENLDVVDLHYGYETNEQLPKQFHKENAANILVPEDRPKPEKILDRLTTKRLTKAGKRLKECHQFARVTEMLDYDEAQEQGLQKEVDALFAHIPPPEAATFVDDHAYDDYALSYRQIYDECVVRMTFPRKSRTNSHFPGGVAVNSNASNIQRVNGVPIPQLIHERHYPLDEASVFSADSLVADQKKHLSDVKLAEIKVLRQIGWRERQARKKGIELTEPEDPSIAWGDDANRDDIASCTSSLVVAYDPIVKLVVPPALRYRSRFHDNKCDETIIEEPSIDDSHDSQSHIPEIVQEVKETQQNPYLAKKTQEILDQHKEKISHQKYRLKSKTCLAKQSDKNSMSKEKEKYNSRTRSVGKTSNNERFSLKKQIRKDKETPAVAVSKLTDFTTSVPTTNTHTVSGTMPSTVPVGRPSVHFKTATSGHSSDPTRKKFKLKKKYKSTSNA